MKIDHKLIAKYHLGQCSPTEKLLVEEWLMDDTFESNPIPISTAKKNKLENDIWADINTYIETAEAPIEIKRKKYPLKYVGIAASFLILLSFGLHQFNNMKEKTDATFDNARNGNLKYINQQNYKIVLGKNATAQINTDTGIIKTTGNMLFIPKRNFAFSMPGADKKKELKTGEIYFVLQPQKNGKQVIIAKSELTFLAPTLQHELKLQFNII
ncbi:MULTISPECIES: hypothetical protein [unclassified Sphingobacterium]|uniref:hypothetical protein n=1 Tax=unclassified Sphingobacterium TaxID=2609468 RepID=UPI0025D5BA34|nr:MULTISPECIES: hypothetical protein [unclassified Sphingobacterium]